jgi:SAM-dependent methyltransferase
MWLFLQKQTTFFEKPMRILVIAPDRALEKQGRRLHPDYLSGDLEQGFAMELMDLTSTGLPDGDRDLVIAYHVLEHIPDDRAAMKEIRRILRPGGMALLEVPLRGDDTDEKYMNASPEVRTQHYLQPDHVRWYGERDFVSRLTEAGLAVERWAVGEKFAAELPVNALDPREVFFVVRPEATAN